MSNGPEAVSYPNYIHKRQALAAELVYQVTVLTDTLARLAELRDQRATLPQDFQDADFQTGLDQPAGGTGAAVRIDHLTAYSAGATFDFGITPLYNAYLGGSPTVQSVLLAARP